MSVFSFFKLKIIVRILLLVSVASLLSSCYWMNKKDYNKAYGDAGAISRQNAHLQHSALSTQAQTILDNRCVVCHACYDAPCQLKLNSIEGIDRGANKTPIYNAYRLLANTPSHFFEDGEGRDEWRKQEFFPVLNERIQDKDTNLDLSVMYQMLTLKNENPNPSTALLPDVFDLKLVRNQYCPKIEEFADFKSEHPLWGMPYGLPAIPEKEFSVVKQWLEEGAQIPLRPALSNALQLQIQRWEALLNGSTLKDRLVARYLYEHLYLADLYFDEIKEQQFFRVVRSYTPPGQAIKVMPSRRPYDAPLNPLFYYRIKPIYSSIVAKTHMPYALNTQRYQLWQQLFYLPTYPVTTLPSYDIATSSNPFITFEQIPMRSRYKFLLEEAQFSIMNFIKGPVCRGQVALSVINDHFWVVFVNPDLKVIDAEEQFLRENKDLLQFPAYWESNGKPWNWLTLAKNQKVYMERRTQFMNEHLNKDVRMDINVVWDGYGKNPNAALSIFRHFDSATVVKGFAGNNPQTAWLITYPLLERIHYLLVAGFDVNGNIVHQLLTRLYMDFLRMEGEANFLSLLPKQTRLEVQSQWYEGASSDVHDYFDVLVNQLAVDSKIPYVTNDPKKELFSLLAKHTHAKRYPLNFNQPNLKAISALAKLNSMQGYNVSFLAQTSIIEVQVAGKSYWYSLLHHNVYQNKTRLLTEAKARSPEKDSVLLTEQIISAYPNAFFSIKANQVADFITKIQQLSSEKDYQLLKDQCGVRRTDLGFWLYSDRLHQYFKSTSGIEYGLLDYNRLENR